MISVIVLSAITFSIVISFMLIEVYKHYTKEKREEEMFEKLGKTAYNYGLSGKLVTSKKEKKLAGLVDREFRDLIKNETPELLNQFPESMAYAEQNDLVPQAEGFILGSIVPIITGIVSRLNPTTPTEQAVVKTAQIAQINPIQQLLQGFITGLANRQPTPAQAKGVPEKKETFGKDASKVRTPDII